MESTPEQAAEGLALCRVLASVLERLVQANGSLAQTDPGQVTRFHAMKAPGIAIQQYLERIHKYASCSNECFVFALIYIDRLIQRSNFLLTELNVHRVVITAVLLAAKFYDDAYYNNAYYAKVGGVLVSEMNGLEIDFLFRINFSLHVAPDIFAKYRNELLVHSSSVASNNITLTPIMEPVYSPQTVPMQPEPTARIQQHHGQHQVTPSPPTPDRHHHYLPPDHGMMNAYDFVQQQHSNAMAYELSQHLGLVERQDSLFPQVVPPPQVHGMRQHYPEHFCDNPYYVPPAPTIHQYYDVAPQDCWHGVEHDGGVGFVRVFASRKESSGLDKG